MYELIQIREEGGRIRLQILLDDKQKHASGEPKRHFMVDRDVPLPPPGDSLDVYLTSQLTLLGSELAGVLSVRQMTPFDPFAKWRGYTWS